ncbi:tetratricopeptide repeat protein [Streptomyces sp. ACT015]|uniref:tetratricopeptide repeat protein n=1 Tax=Streptomyces sp. ACT015 TaxID=3134807 RepID=UPI003D179B67
MSRPSRDKKRALVAAPIDVRVSGAGPDGTRAPGASVGGVPVAAAPGEELQQAVLNHLQRIARATGHAVRATVHDERIGYVVPLRVEPDGSSDLAGEPVRMPTAPARPAEVSPPEVSGPVPRSGDAATAPSPDGPDRSASPDEPTRVLRTTGAPVRETAPTFPLRAVPEPLPLGGNVPTFPLRAVPEEAAGTAPMSSPRALPAPEGDHGTGTVAPPLGAFGPPPRMDAVPAQDGARERERTPDTTTPWTPGGTPGRAPGDAPDRAPGGRPVRTPDEGPYRMPDGDKYRTSDGAAGAGVGAGTGAAAGAAYGFPPAAGVPAEGAYGFPPAAGAPAGGAYGFPPVTGVPAEGAYGPPPVIGGRSEGANGLPPATGAPAEGAYGFPPVTGVPAEGAYGPPPVIGGRSEGASGLLPAAGVPAEGAYGFPPAASPVPVVPQSADTLPAVLADPPAPVPSPRSLTSSPLPPALAEPEPDARPTPARGFDAVAEAVLGAGPADPAPSVLAEPMARINEAVREGRIEAAAELAAKTVADSSRTLGAGHPEVLRLRELTSYIAYLAGDPVRSLRLSLDLAGLRRRAGDAEAAYGNVQSAFAAWRAVREPGLGLELGRELIGLWTDLAAEEGPAADDIEQLESARARMGRLTERARRAE